MSSSSSSSCRVLSSGAEVLLRLGGTDTPLELRHRCSLSRLSSRFGHSPDLALQAFELVLQLLVGLLLLIQLSLQLLLGVLQSVDLPLRFVHLTFEGLQAQIQLHGNQHHRLQKVRDKNHPGVPEGPHWGWAHTWSFWSSREFCSSSPRITMSLTFLSSLRLASCRFARSLHTQKERHSQSVNTSALSLDLRADFAQLGWSTHTSFLHTRFGLWSWWCHYCQTLKKMKVCKLSSEALSWAPGSQLQPQTFKAPSTFPPCSHVTMHLIFASHLGSSPHLSSPSSLSSSSCIRASSWDTRFSLLDFWEPSRWDSLLFRSLFYRGDRQRRQQIFLLFNKFENWWKKGQDQTIMKTRCGWNEWADALLCIYLPSDSRACTCLSRAILSHSRSCLLALSCRSSFLICSTCQVESRHCHGYSRTQPEHNC